MPYNNFPSLANSSVSSNMVGFIVDSAIANYVAAGSGTISQANITALFKTGVSVTDLFNATVMNGYATTATFLQSIPLKTVPSGSYTSIIDELIGIKNSLTPGATSAQQTQLTAIPGTYNDFMTYTGTAAIPGNWMFQNTLSINTSANTNVGQQPLLYALTQAYITYNTSIANGTPVATADAAIASTALTVAITGITLTSQTITTLLPFATGKYYAGIQAAMTLISNGTILIAGATNTNHPTLSSANGGTSITIPTPLYSTQNSIAIVNSNCFTIFLSNFTNASTATLVNGNKQSLGNLVVNPVEPSSWKKVWERSVEGTTISGATLAQFSSAATNLSYFETLVDPNKLLSDSDKYYKYTSYAAIPADLIAVSRISCRGEYAKSPVNNSVSSMNRIFELVTTISNTNITTANATYTILNGAYATTGNLALTTTGLSFINAIKLLVELGYTSKFILCGKPLDTGLNAVSDIINFIYYGAGVTVAASVTYAGQKTAAGYVDSALNSSFSNAGLADRLSLFGRLSGSDLSITSTGATSGPLAFVKSTDNPWDVFTILNKSSAQNYTSTPSGSKSISSDDLLKLNKFSEMWKFTQTPEYYNSSSTQSYSINNILSRAADKVNNFYQVIAAAFSGDNVIGLNKLTSLEDFITANTFAPTANLDSIHEIEIDKIIFANAPNGKIIHSISALDQPSTNKVDSTDATGTSFNIDKALGFNSPLYTLVNILKNTNDKATKFTASTGSGTLSEAVGFYIVGLDSDKALVAMKQFFSTTLGSLNTSDITLTQAQDLLISINKAIVSSVATGGLASNLGSWLYDLLNDVTAKAPEMVMIANIVNALSQKSSSTTFTISTASNVSPLTADQRASMGVVFPPIYNTDATTKINTVNQQYDIFIKKNANFYKNLNTDTLQYVQDMSYNINGPNNSVVPVVAVVKSNATALAPWAKVEMSKWGKYLPVGGLSTLLSNGFTIDNLLDVSYVVTNFDYTTGRSTGNVTIQLFPAKTLVDQGVVSKADLPDYIIGV